MSLISTVTCSTCLWCRIVATEYFVGLCSLRMYNSLVDRCFRDCVESFRRKDLEKTEEKVCQSFSKVWCKYHAQLVTSEGPSEAGFPCSASSPAAKSSSRARPVSECGLLSFQAKLSRRWPRFCSQNEWALKPWRDDVSSDEFGHMGCKSARQCPNTPCSRLEGRGQDEAVFLAMSIAGCIMLAVEQHAFWTSKLELLRFTCAVMRLGSPVISQCAHVIVHLTEKSRYIFWGQVHIGQRGKVTKGDISSGGRCLPDKWARLLQQGMPPILAGPSR